jgi:hypothetical protein
MRRLTGIAGIALALAACGAPLNEAYPLRSEPGAGATLPAKVGEPRSTVVIWLLPRTGDRIELVDAEAVGSLDGASTEVLVSRPVLHADGTSVLGEAFEPLAGTIVESTTATPDPVDTVGIAVRLTASRPGRYEVTSIRLEYRLNGGPVRVAEGIDAVITVCADDPAPATCEPEPTP